MVTLVNALKIDNLLICDYRSGVHMHRKAVVKAKLMYLVISIDMVNCSSRIMDLCFIHLSGWKTH